MKGSRELCRHDLGDPAEVRVVGLDLPANEVEECDGAQVDDDSEEGGDGEDNE